MLIILECAAFWRSLAQARDDVGLKLRAVSKLAL